MYTVGFRGSLVCTELTYKYNAFSKLYGLGSISVHIDLMNVESNYNFHMSKLCPKKERICRQFTIKQAFLKFLKMRLGSSFKYMNLTRTKPADSNLDNETIN